jgi:dCMP deaminase
MPKQKPPLGGFCFVCYARSGNARNLYLAYTVFSKGKTMAFPYKRPSWDESHMMAAISAATRTSCLVRAVGAVLVKDKRVVAGGYNGAPPKITSCLQTGECSYKRAAYTEWQENGGNLDVLYDTFKPFCIAAHAEANAIAQCAIMGVSTHGCTLYVTNFPCPNCVRENIILCGITEVVVWKEYLSKPLLTTDEKRVSESLLRQADISFRYVKISKRRMSQINTLAQNVGDRTEYRFEP